MTSVAGLAAAATAIAALAACGGDDGSGEAATATPKAPKGITVALEERNASAQSGTATLTPRAKGFDVALEVTKPVKFEGDAQNAHIHSVTCAEYEAIKDFNAQLETVEDSLYNLDGGKSTTTVGVVKLAERTTGGFSINVHEENYPYTVVACGDIPKR